MIKLTKEMPADVLVTTPASAQTSCNEGALNGAAVTNSNTTAGIASNLKQEIVDVNNSAVHAQNHSNNTISAAADSSDNQPSSPQLHRATGIEDTGTQNPTPPQQSYAGNDVYGNAQSTNAMYSQHGYSQANLDLQQQQQHQRQHHHQQQLHLHPSSTQNPLYPSFLQSYHQFYQQQQQQQQTPIEGSTLDQHPHQMEFGNPHAGTLFSTSAAAEAGVNYNQYGCNPASGITAMNSQNSNSNNALDISSQPVPVISVATSSVTSPRVGSSSSPSSSNQMQVSGRASSMSAGNPSSPNSAGSLQCKKCGVMCASDAELQEHITSVHGASPYGSSGYASSPYIKEEMQQQTPPSQSQQQAPAAQQAAAQGVNIGEILDLDSQKLLYPPAAGTVPAMMHANLGNVSNPLHGLHNMQQRAGINTWDHQAPEGLPPYMQQQSSAETKNISDPFYQSAKQSPYTAANNSSPVIKTEYTGDSQQSFDPAAPNQQQQMMPPAVSSSPAEFPTTTTGGPQDNQQQNEVSNQQFRSGNFEPPSSSSSSNMASGPVGTKAANWKSNEARRPKTYNCTACKKWFTSSGHLKRHYNTTLHKNAVKSSGQPDPATLPISAHHHPARDPNGKASRGRGANAAANNNAQLQQQPPNPVQPPEPPNSPQGYGTAQVGALSHFTASGSPNGLYEHNQYSQHQYVSQVQSTTNNAPHHTTSVNNHNLLQNQQQQTALNGHPNALAGLSVPATVYQHQAPMPSSQMRGLLTTTTPLSTATGAKMQQMEAAALERGAEDFDYLSKVEVKREYMEKMEEEVVEEEEGQVPYQQDNAMCPPKVEKPESEKDLLIQQQLQPVQTLRGDHNAEHDASQQILHYQPDPSQLEGMPTSYHNITLSSTHSMHNNTQELLHPTTSQPIQQHRQMADLVTYTLTPAPPQLQQLNTAEQHYISMPLGTSNMLQLQPQPTITEQQQPATTIPTLNMVSMQPLNQHTQRPLLQHMELQPPANMSLQLGTINTNTQLHTTTINNTSMPLYHQQQHPDSEAPQLVHTSTCHPTISGNTDIMTVQSNGSLTASSGQKDTVTSTGQLVQILPLFYPVPAMYQMQSFSDHLLAAEKSPAAGDVPHKSYSLSTTPTSVASCSPTVYQSDSSETDDKECSIHGIISEYLYSEGTPAPPGKSADNFTDSSTASNETANKRSRNSSSSSSADASSEVLPNGRIKCLPCDKEFTKICYLTQHNNSFHSGEYPYRCQKCGKRYQVEDTYTNHLSRHKTTDKDHKCILCPKQFHHKTDLRRHIEAIHTGNKQHACQVCGKSFCRKDHLRKHIQTHSRTRAVPKKNQTRRNAASLPKTNSQKSSPSPKCKLITNETPSGDTKLLRSTASAPAQTLEECMLTENIQLLVLEDNNPLFNSNFFPTQQQYRQAESQV